MLVRPPFIWTPEQPINPMGFLAVLSGAPARDDGRNRWFLFRRGFHLTAAPSRAAIDITVDGRYQLFVNGTRVGRGPVRCSPLFQRYDSYDVAPWLRTGSNALAVLVHVYGVDTAFYERTRGLWQPSFGDGGLWVNGEIEAGGEIVRLASDAAWRCHDSAAWLRDTPRANSGLGFIEALDGRLLPDGWTDPAFDDRGWLRARPLVAGGGGPEAPFGGLITRPFPTLLPSGIPHLTETPAVPERIVWTRGLVADPSLPLEARCYREALVPLPDAAIVAAERLLASQLPAADGATRVTTDEGMDVAILVDFGRIVTGHPRIALLAGGGETIEIACSERLPGEWDAAGPSADARITPVPMLGLDAHLCRYIARLGQQVFERFEWCAVRWMQVTVRAAPRGLDILELGATLTGYPVEERGHFACSDPFLTRLWSVGAYTLRQCMHDAWEDCPSREQRQWLGDATVENLVGHVAFGPCVAALNAKFLRQAAESQRPDGLTQMFAPGDHHTDGLIIPDWTLQWILNAGDHWRYTGDARTIAAIFPSVLKALAWFDRASAASGLVVDLPYWHFMDWAGVGRHGQACAVNAQLAGAFASASVLAESLGWVCEATRLRRRAEAIGHALDAAHWDETRGVYVDVVDPATGAREDRVSQHANAAMALWAQPPAERIGRALARIVDPSRLTFTAAPPIVPTGETLDPAEGVVLANTFYSHFVYEALARHGRLDAALELMRGHFGPMLARGATTLWESFEPTGSLCHGFSASPTYQLSTWLLGVRPAAPGFSEIAFSPNLAGLDWAQGRVPSARGDVAVALTRTADGFDAEVSAPKEASVRAQAAPGYSLEGGARTIAPNETAHLRFRVSVPSAAHSTGR